MLAAACTDSMIRLIDVRTGEKRVIRTGVKPGYVSRVSFTPDGKTIVGVGGDHRLRLWDVASTVGSIEAGDAGGVAVPGTLAFSPDGKSLASAASGIGVLLGDNGVVVGQKVINDVKLWDIATGGLKWTSAARDGVLTALVFSPDGETVFCCDDSATSRINARSGEDRQDLMRAN
jgi:WD40 repeat protein